jgi:hypothetical protein
MRFLHSLGSWLPDFLDQERLISLARILAVIGWGLAAAALLIWSVYRLAAWRRQSRTRNLQRSLAISKPGGEKELAAAEEKPVGLTPEEYKAYLKYRHEELHQELGGLEAEETSARDILDKEQEVIQEKLADLATAFAKLQRQLANVGQALDDFRREFPPEQLDRARQALARGELGPAETLLKQALARGGKLEAEASFQLGVLAEGQVDYFLAAQYYYYAAQLKPKNLAFLSAAGEFAYYLRHYPEAEGLLKGAFEIQEKLLGSEHPEVAQRLNNLGALYHSVGGYEKAEALYQWALEIDEASLGPDHPNVATYLENYAALLKELGREAEAKPMAARARAIREKKEQEEERAES